MYWIIISKSRDIKVSPRKARGCFILILEPFYWSSQTSLLGVFEATSTMQTWLPIAETDLGWAAAGAPTFEDS